MKKLIFLAALALAFATVTGCQSISPGSNTSVQQAGTSPGGRTDPSPMAR